MTIDTLNPLDAVMSGYAYENATTAIGVIEEGKNAKRWISTEMLCTLDNFIKVVLFNERIFVTGCVDLDNNHFVPKNAEYQAGGSGRQLLEKAQVFLPITEMKGDGKEVGDRISKILHPANIQQNPLFTIRCKLSKQQLTIFQEMVYLDAYFIEYAIEQFGAERFKPVFPGEHLYLGLRQKRVADPQATHTIADIPGRRLRAVVREKMERLNAFVSQGAPMLPGLPPLFASRIMHECANGSGFIPTLLEIRNSPAMTRFRKWMIKCWDLSRGTDFAQRTKAAEALQKLNTFTPKDDISPTDIGISLLNIIKGAATYDVVAVIDEMVPPLVKYLGGIPLSGLRQFGGKVTDPNKVGMFLETNFGDKFNRNEMDFISHLLQLPDDLADWAKQEADFTVDGGRYDPQAPPLARPCFIQTQNKAFVSNAKADFDELLKDAVRVTPELLKEWEANKKVP